MFYFKLNPTKNYSKIMLDYKPFNRILKIY